VSSHDDDTKQENMAVQQEYMATKQENMAIQQEKSFSEKSFL